MNYLYKILFFILIGNFIITSCVTFNLDLNNYDNIPDGNWIARANGNWNGWGNGITLSDDDNDGIHSGTSCIFENDDYEYIFVITGEFDNWSGWGLTGNPPLGSSCDFKWWDSWANYGFTIDNADYETPIYPWGCCDQTECVDQNWEGCVGAGIRTVDSYLYGRFETRMKSADGDGIISSFFTYNTDFDNGSGNLNWNEIDIEMTGNNDSSVQFTTHHPGDPNSWSATEIVEVGYDPHEEFRDYAIEWTPDYIKWFIDNTEVYQQTLPLISDISFSQKIMMNLWATTAANWAGEWDYQDVPKFSYYDYVKYYSYSPDNGNYGTDDNFLFIWEDDFNDYNTDIWINDPSGELGHCGFSQSNINYYNGHLIMTLRDVADEMICNQVTGDTNGDNILNVTDIIFIINIILNNSFSEIGICNSISVDYDFNQILNIVDIIGLIDLIIN